MLDTAQDFRGESFSSGFQYCGVPSRIAANKRTCVICLCGYNQYNVQLIPLQRLIRSVWHLLSQMNARVRWKFTGTGNCVEW